MAAVMAFGTGVSAFAEDGFISLAPIEESEEIISEEKIFEEIEYIEEETELLNASAENRLEEIIRPQIEAYAKSIDKKDANKKAQDVLLRQGMSGKGKKLSVGENHALAATLMNSEVVKEALPFCFSKLLEARKERGTEEIYSCGGLGWPMSSAHFCYVLLYDYDYRPKCYYKENGDFMCPSNYFNRPLEKRTVTKSNAYDKTLELIAGGMCVHIELNKSEVYKDKTVYDANLLFFDIFDFSDENEGTLGNLLGFIGLFLFKPFEWESEFSFQIEVPNDCEHSYESVVKNPTCTEKGSATHTCTLCGYSYTEEIAAKDHSLGEWSLYAEPTVGKAGEERRSCANCDYYESKEIAAYRYGDVNCDGKVNTIDANYARRYAVGLLTLDERKMLAADVDGNGAINVLDSAFIRRHTVKLINVFPAEDAAE